MDETDLDVEIWAFENFKYVELRKPSKNYDLYGTIEQKSASVNVFVLVVRRSCS